MAERNPLVRASGAEISIVRLFEAPRQVVWQEWTEPECFADWFGGPQAEVPLSTVSMDIRPGGKWSATTLCFGPDRRDIRWTGEYLVVARPTRLTFTISGLPGRYTPEVVTVVLEDLGDARTEMRFHQHGRLSRSEYEIAERQWLTEFDRIADRLTDVRARPPAAG